MKEYVRSLWKRLMHRDLRYRDRHARIDELYRLSDPWDMDTDRERFRFQETNRLIEAAFGRPGTILEVGCGEGHQSEYLAKICDRLSGIDVSGRALRRARDRVPRAEFETAALEGSLLARSGAPFDLVVAAEVLYYMTDVAACLARMEETGKACFVTYYDKDGAEVDAILMARGVTTRGEFEYAGTRWIARWWVSETMSGPGGRRSGQLG